MIGDGRSSPEGRRKRKGRHEFGATAAVRSRRSSRSGDGDELLAAGADPNMPIMSGETPLMVASSRGNVETVRALDGRRKAQWRRKNMGGQTAMMWAIRSVSSAVVDELVKHGADVELASMTGFTR